MTAPQPLASAFPACTEADWRAATARGRRGGGDAADSLFPRGLRGPIVGGRVIGERWRPVERIDLDAVATAAKAVREAIAGGASGVEIAFSGNLHPLGGGLPVASAREIASGLTDVLPAGFGVYIDAAGIPEVVAAFVELAASTRAELRLAFDPIAALAVRGQHRHGFEERSTWIAALAQTFDERGVAGDVVMADCRVWHAAGATEEQELGVALATFVAYLRQTGAAGRIGVALSADPDQFRTIAKFRAMRMMLARVAEIAGVPMPRLRAETAWRTMSTRSPEMNILRATSAAFGAATGGADAITVLPFDALGGGDSHGRRLACNTQMILAEEAQVFRVADPAAGSGAIEALTDTFAGEGWARFRAIEAQGGIVAAIAGGTLLADVARERDARIAAVNSSATRMVGVNAYVGAEGAVVAGHRDAVRAEPETLIFKRLAEGFEGPAQ